MPANLAHSLHPTFRLKRLSVGSENFFAAHRNRPNYKLVKYLALHVPFHMHSV